jgi:hypothetical protein
MTARGCDLVTMEGAQRSFVACPARPPGSDSRVPDAYSQDRCQTWAWSLSQASNSTTGYPECVSTYQHSAVRALAVMPGKSTASRCYQAGQLDRSKSALCSGNMPRRSAQPVPGPGLRSGARLAAVLQHIAALHNHNADPKMVGTQDVTTHGACVDISMKDLPI